MAFYEEKDRELFKDKIDELEYKIQKYTGETLDPTFKLKKELAQIVVDFVKENKRKIYGGTAQNALIVEKNPDDAIYDDVTDPDIDFYSPDPIVDAMKLANIFAKKGYQGVEAREAEHKNTYKIYVETFPAADISYVPTNIFHKMPFQSVNGVNYIAPNFIMIDMFKMLTDPLNSGAHRWRKTFNRIFLLQKHFPFNEAKHSIKTSSKTTEEGNKIKQAIEHYILKNTNMIFFGAFAYNKFLQESNIMKDKQKGKKYHYLPVDHYELISTNYIEDCNGLLKLIKEMYPEFYKDLEVVEYTPLWTLTCYCVEISYKGKLLAFIMDNSKKCGPIKKVNFYNVEGNKLVDTKEKVDMVAFDNMFLMSMIMTFRYKVLERKNEYQYYNILVSHLVELRNYFFSTSGKNWSDDTLFEEFIIECKGEAINLRKEVHERRAQKKKMGKPVIWIYRPTEDNLAEPVTTYNFENISGNKLNEAFSKLQKGGNRFVNITGKPVKNEKNKRIVKL